MSMPPPIQPAPAPAALPDMGLIVKAYRDVRDAIDATKKRHAAEIAPLAERLDKLERLALAHLNSSGANSIKTDHGTAYKSERTSVSVGDAEAFEAFTEAHPELREIRASKSAVERYIDEQGEVPPGLNISREVRVNFRK